MSQPNHSRTVAKSLFAVVAMFAFGFAMVPLYEVFCDITGLNGKTGGRYTVEDQQELKADESRLIRVQFITQNNENMPWEFKPLVHELKVHPGELTAVNFYARNPTSKPMTAQAVPSLSPSRGIDYFHKTECFCFERQTLAGNEEINMPLRFVVDKALPKDVTVLTLSYTIFDLEAISFTESDANIVAFVSDFENSTIFDLVDLDS